MDQSFQRLPLIRRFRVLKAISRYNRSNYLSGGTFMVAEDKEYLIQFYRPNFGDLTLVRLGDTNRYQHSQDRHVGSFMSHELDEMVKLGWWEETTK